MARPFKCPCGASDSVGKGVRVTKTKGVRRIRRCKVCGRKFTPQNQKPLETRPTPDAPAPNSGGQAAETHEEDEHY